MEGDLTNSAGILDQVTALDSECIKTCNPAMFLEGQRVLVSPPNTFGKWDSATITHVQIAKNARDEAWISLDVMPEGIGVGSYIVVEVSSGR